MTSNKPVLLILAGGSSRRFWPLTHKMDLKFMGSTFLQKQLDFFEKCGFSEILLVVPKNSTFTTSSSKIKIIKQQGQGQGEAILSAKPDLTKKAILIVNGDDLVEESLFKNVLNFAKDTHLLVGYKTKNYFPGGYLVLQGKQIAKIHEKPGVGNEPSSFVRLVCDYYPKGSKLVSYLEKTKNINPDTHYEDTLSKMIEENIKFEMVEYEGTWIPLKYPWQVLNLTNYYLHSLKSSKKPKSVSIHKTASISGIVVFEEGVKVMEYAKLVGPLYIGKNTIIGNHTLIRESIIGSDCVVGFNTDVTRSYLGDQVWLHSNYIGDSVLSDRVTIGAGTILANLRLDEGEVFSNIKDIRQPTYRTKLGAILGQGVRIGVTTSLMPGVKVGTNSIIGAGVVLRQDIDDRQKCYIKQEHEVVTQAKNLVSNRENFRKSL